MIYTNLNNISKKYDLLYADPPWSYSDKSKSHGGGAESHYTCMSIQDICALNIQRIAKDDAILLMWATYPQLDMAVRVISEWGFVYKTVAWTWVKLSSKSTPIMGMGRYTRSNPEVVLLGRRGRGLERKRNDIHNVQFHRRLGHSEKPSLFRVLSENLFGEVDRIELFSRQAAENWDSFGDEVFPLYQAEMTIESRDQQWKIRKYEPLSGGCCLCNGKTCRYDLTQNGGA